MSFSKSLASFIVLLLCTARPTPISAAGPLPISESTAGFNWQTATPESQGINRSKLEIMLDVLASRNTKAVLIIRNDRVVTEWYAPGFSRTERHHVASAAKGLAGGMALLVALNDGHIGIEDYASKYISSWRDDPVKAKIQIKHLAAHTSGIEDADGPEAWKQAFWDKIPDPFSVAIEQAPVIFAPGSNMAYSNPGIAALDYALTASLRGSAQSDIQTTLQARIMEPIGIPTSEWSIGYGTTYLLDGLHLQATWGGASYTARAAAKIGRLMLRQGNWEGKQLVGSAWVARMVAQVDSRFESGLCWFNNAIGEWRALPRDAYATAGSGHNILLVVPSLNLLVVRLGTQIMDETDFWLGFEEYLFEPLMEAIDKGNEVPDSQQKVGVFRSGRWMTDSNGDFTSEGDPPGAVFTFGPSNSVPIYGDWNGSGTTKAGIFVNGYWVLDYNGNGQYDGPIDDRFFVLGPPNSIPVYGDWNGSGSTKVGVFVDGYWVLDYNGNGQYDGPVTDRFLVFGAAGFQPVVGDWNGSGKTKIGIYEKGVWVLDINGNFAWDGAPTEPVIYFGTNGFTPVLGDWNGSGNTKIGIYKDGIWVLDANGNLAWDGAPSEPVIHFGTSGQIPVVGDWNGKGNQKIGVFENGRWMLDYNGDQSWSGSVIDRFFTFGRSGDTPTVGKW